MHPRVIAFFPCLEKVLVQRESAASLGCQNTDLFSCRHKYMFTFYSRRVWWDFHTSWSHQNSVIPVPDECCVGKTCTWTADINLCMLSTHTHSLFTGHQQNASLKIKVCNIARWLQNIKPSMGLLSPSYNFMGHTPVISALPILKYRSTLHPAWGGFELTHHPCHSC